MDQNLLPIAEIARRLDIPETTARFYRNRFESWLPYVGEGRRKRFRPEALEVFTAIVEGMREGRTAAEVETLLAGRFPRNIAVSRRPDPVPAAVAAAPSVQLPAEVQIGAIGRAIGLEIAEAIGERLRDLLAVPSREELAAFKDEAARLATELATEQATSAATAAAGDIAGNVARDTAQEVAETTARSTALAVAESTAGDVARAVAGEMTAQATRAATQAAVQAAGESARDEARTTAESTARSLAGSVAAEIGEAKAREVASDIIGTVGRVASEAAKLAALELAESTARATAQSVARDEARSVAEEAVRAMEAPLPDVSGLEAELAAVRQERDNLVMRVDVLDRELARLRKDRREMEQYLLDKIKAISKNPGV